MSAKILSNIKHVKQKWPKNAVKVDTTYSEIDSYFYGKQVRRYLKFLCKNMLKEKVRIMKSGKALIQVGIFQDGGLYEY